MTSQENKSDQDNNSKNTKLAFDKKEDQQDLSNRAEISGKKSQPVLTERKKKVQFSKESNAKQVNPTNPGNQNPSKASLIDPTFNPEKEFEEIITRYQAKKLEESSKLKQIVERGQDVKLDASTGSSVDSNVTKNLYLNQQVEKKDKLTSADLVEAQPGES